MSNKNDWEELEKWNAQRIDNEKEKTGFYFEEFKRNKKIDVASRFTELILKIVAFVVVIILLFILVEFLRIQFSNLRAKYTIDVVPTIQNMYGISINVISKNIDRNKDGTYKLQAKNNKEIIFTATKNGVSLNEDFLDRYHKYYFNKWDSSSKEKFSVKQNIDNEILEYKTYIEIDSSEEIEDAVNAIFEFESFCNEKYFRMWNIYIAKDDKVIYLYQGGTISKEEEINHAKEMYNRYFGAEYNTIE